MRNVRTLDTFYLPLWGEKMKCKWHEALIICIWIVFLTVFPGETPVVAAPNHEAKVVRVGYLENYGVLTDAKNAEKRGYGYDYLAEIAKYTGWKYEFISCGWNDGLEKLRNGEIDIFGPMQKTPEREAEFEFPFREMGFEYGAIYVPQGKNFFYDDAASLNGMRVGMIKNNFYQRRLDEYCRNNNIQVIYVDTEADALSKGLADGSFDAVCVGSIIDIPDTSVAIKISSEPYYYATTKGNQEVLDGLNLSILQIMTKDAYFAAKLDRKYYSDKSINLPLFTRQEAAFIQTKRKLRVVGDPVWSPIEYIEENDGQYRGITIDILKEIQNETGIAFEFIKTDNYAQSMELIREGKADLLIGFNEYAKDLGISYSKQFLEVPVFLVGRKTGDLKNILRVAMPSLNTETAEQIIKKYPHFIYTAYHDMNSTLHSLRTDQERYAFINAYEFSEISRLSSPNDFVSISTAISMPLKIGIAKTVDPIVVNILNKSIDRLRPEQISAIVFANTAGKPFAVPLSRILKENALLIGIALISMFCLAIFLIQQNNKRAKSHLERIAYIDDITGLLTTAKFKLDVEAILRGSKPFEYTMISLDIDNFKYINDSFGYDMGNEVLSIVAQNLKRYIGPGERIGRANADQFIMLTKTLPWDQLLKKYDAMTNVKDQLPLCLPEEYRVIFSGGAYVINRDDDINNILDKANIARKSNKNVYKNAISEYTKEMDEHLEWKKHVTLYMEHALGNSEFVVYLQPKFRFEDEIIVGAEALVRWNHPQKGLIAPGMFIPIFEKNGFIQKLDMYVFEQVCALIKWWYSSHFPEIPIAVSVNLSRLHLSNHSLVEELIELTEQYGIQPQQIEIELTESMLFDSIEIIVDFMQRLKDAGFMISIDDFGSGYSSLSLLKDLPADVLKIDKGFLDKSADTQKGRMVLSSIIEIAEKVNMITVAEGVETAEQAKFLRDIGCDIAQGYYYARPMSVDAFEQLVIERGAKAPIG